MCRGRFAGSGPQVQASALSWIWCFSDGDRRLRFEYLFNFDNTFEIHDDIEVLKAHGHGLRGSSQQLLPEDLRVARSLVPKRWSLMLEAGQWHGEVTCPREEQKQGGEGLRGLAVPGVVLPVGFAAEQVSGSVLLPHAPAKLGDPGKRRGRSGERREASLCPLVVGSLEPPHWVAWGLPSLQDVREAAPCSSDPLASAAARRPLLPTCPWRGGPAGGGGICVHRRGGRGAGPLWPVRLLEAVSLPGPCSAVFAPLRVPSRAMRPLSQKRPVGSAS